MRTLPAPQTTPSTYLLHRVAVNAKRDAEPVVVAESNSTLLGSARERVRHGLGLVRALGLLGAGGGRETRVLEVLVGERGPGSLRGGTGLGQVLSEVGRVVVLIVSEDT